MSPFAGESLQCGDQVVLQAIVGMVALIAAYAGYRIYTVSIGLCGALTAFAIIGGIGLQWYGGVSGLDELFGKNVASASDIRENLEDEQQIKLGIIAFFCLVWGVMGAVVCVNTHGKIQKMLGFVVGAALGFTAVAVIVTIASSQVHKASEEAVHEYKGWEWYTKLAAGVPIACMVGYATRNLIMYVLMAATAFVGSFVGIGLLGHALECATTTQVEPMILLGVAVLSTVAALIFQVKMTPEAQRGSRTPTVCESKV
jgi:hypothetical protein